MYKIGVDIGGSHIGVGIVDNSGNILIKMDKDINKSYKPQGIVEEVISLLNLICKDFDIEIKDIESIGIGIPGVIKDNKIINTPNLSLGGYNLEEEMKKHIDVPINICNDANCATIAENLFGNLKGCNNGVLITLGTGIGAGIIINKELYIGNNGGAGEIGWTIIKDNKSFGKLASITALRSMVIQEFELEDSITGKELVKILKNEYKTNEGEDYRINQIIDEYVENLSIGILNVIKTLDVDKVVLGGSFVYYKEIFLSKIIQKVNELNKKLEGSYRCKIDIAKFNNDAGIIGASQL